MPVSIVAFNYQFSDDFTGYIKKTSDMKWANVGKRNNLR